MSHPPRLPFGATWHVDIAGPGDMRWTLSPEVYRLHGLTPDAEVQGLDLIVAGHHPDDADLLARTREALLSHQAFAHRRTLVRARDSVEVFVVGAGEYDDTGRLTGVSGLFIELQDVVRDAVTQQLAEVVAARGTIEQAKGVLMTVYGIDADSAFDLLGWYSQRTNTKVRLLAERLADGASRTPRDVGDIDRHVGSALDPAADARLSGLLQDIAPWDPQGPAAEVTRRQVDGHELVAVAGDLDGARTPGAVDGLRAALAAVDHPMRPHALDLSGVGHVCPTAAQAVASLVLKHLQRPAALHVVAGPLRPVLVALGVPAERVVA